jgi:hypothetical protein
MSTGFAIAEAESGGKWVSLSTVEPNPDLALAMRSMGRAFESIAGLMQAQVRLLRWKQEERCGTDLLVRRL